MIGYRRQLVFACFADDSTYKRFVLDISCYNNCLYNSYESANAEEDFDIPESELYDIIMRYSLRYLETNK